MSDILVHTEGGVRTLTFNRTDKKNCITTKMFKELNVILDSAQEDSEIRVLCFQGDSSVFSAGYDITDFLNSPPQSEDTPVIHFLKKLAGFTKPLVAGVCGPAVGIGMTMLLHFDLVYCGDNAEFSTPFVSLGLCAEGGSGLLMPKLMGHQRAADMLFFGDPINAETAQAIGLVNRVLPASEVSGYLQEQAQKLSAKPISSIIETKRLMKHGDEARVIEQIRTEIKSFSELLAGPAANEAFMAFMEKRKPDFSKF
jgi:enoyl-CoA hydratase/carnithine racemase